MIYQPGVLPAQGRAFKYLTLTVGVINHFAYGSPILREDSSLPLPANWLGGSQEREQREGLGHTCPGGRPISLIRSDQWFWLDLAPNHPEACWNTNCRVHLKLSHLGSFWKHTLTKIKFVICGYGLPEKIPGDSLSLICPTVNQWPCVWENSQMLSPVH